MQGTRNESLKPRNNVNHDEVASHWGSERRVAVVACDDGTTWPSDGDEMSGTTGSLANTSSGELGVSGAIPDALASVAAVEEECSRSEALRSTDRLDR
jgi:hypothetical protein